MSNRKTPSSIGENAARPLRIAIITDAAPPQVNGVVRTLGQLRKELERLGHDVLFITPGDFHTIPLPTYPEIRLALFPGRGIARRLDRFQPDAIHIATEGPLGLSARRYCRRHDMPFSTSFHTRFAEYLHARTGIPPSWGYRFLRWFHKPATTLMVATPSLRDELMGRGFQRAALWSRGVDTELFQPRPELLEDHFLGLARPVWLYVGRIAVEKNIDAFLALDLPGTKLVVGEGPRLELLKKRHPNAHFAGPLFGEQLARAYAAADCFVFPSKTDTFGLVLIEALACGTPVAAFPVQGPLDVVAHAPVGCLHDDLATACQKALNADRGTCRDYALGFSWVACARQFLTNLALGHAAAPDIAAMPDPQPADRAGLLVD